MEKYEELEIEVIIFEGEDIITTSGCGDPAPNPGSFPLM